MKKILAFLMPLFICLLMFGCSAVNKIIDEAKQNAGDDTGSEEGDTGDPSGQGSQTGDNNKDAVKSRDEVAELIGDKYLITVRVDGSYTDGSGQLVTEYVEYSTVSDGVYSYWGTSLEDLKTGSLYKRVNEDLVVYDYSEDAGGYTELAVFPTEINPFRSVNIIFLAETEIEYTKKESTTFLGRACTKYEYKESDATVAASATFEREWIMDNTTGACLKYSAAVKGSGIGVSGSASGSFEVTQFEQGSKVDEIIKKISDKIFIKEWDLSVFDKLGLTNTSSLDIYQICTANNIDSSKLQLREASNEVYEDTGNGNYGVMYFAKLSKEEGEKLVKAIITILFNSGAKYNYEGEAQTDPLAEPLCFIETEGELSYGFLASPAQGDPYVAFDGEWNPYIDGGVWSLSLFVYYENK